MFLWSFFFTLSSPPHGNYLLLNSFCFIEIFLIILIVLFEMSLVFFSFFFLLLFIIIYVGLFFLIS